MGGIVSAFVGAPSPPPPPPPPPQVTRKPEAKVTTAAEADKQAGVSPEAARTAGQKRRQARTSKSRTLISLDDSDSTSILG